MDPIHPIVPRSADPAAVDRVRRVARTGDEHAQDEEQERRERPRRAPAPVPPPVVTGDGHIDALA
jgi:hypothetical protein